MSYEVNIMADLAMVSFLVASSTDDNSFTVEVGCVGHKLLQIFFKVLSKIILMIFFVMALTSHSQINEKYWFCL